MEPSYPTDMSDAQWEVISALLPVAKSGGRPRSIDLRAGLNAIFDLVVAGCAGRMLPQEFPKWKTVYPSFRAWRLDGTGERVHTQFVPWEGVAAGHEAVPSAARLDLQSVKPDSHPCGAGCRV